MIFIVFVVRCRRRITFPSFSRLWPNLLLVLVLSCCRTVAGKMYLCTGTIFHINCISTLCIFLVTIDFLLAFCMWAVFFWVNVYFVWTLFYLNNSLNITLKTGIFKVGFRRNHAHAHTHGWAFCFFTYRKPGEYVYHKGKQTILWCV